MNGRLFAWIGEIGGYQSIRVHSHWGLIIARCVREWYNEFQIASDNSCKPVSTSAWKGIG
jgi:hypothetical protein